MGILSIASFLGGVFWEDSMRTHLEVLLPNQTADLSFSIRFDIVSLIFFAVVAIISGTVFLYRKFYIEQEVVKVKIKNNYFFVLLSLFVLSIFLLVFSNSWVLLIVGWDGLGLTSFLLVIFYRNRRRLDSGLVTVLSNRIGDCLFIVGFIPILYRNWFYYDFFLVTHPTRNRFLFSIILIRGAITKRAQYPFSSWLPAAIAAPTPVSSLVHSSTLVTAGVYVALRFNFLMNECFYLFSTVSLLTITLAGARAMVEIDFKKVVAISTLRQIGLMIYTITVGHWVISFFHIVFHAFFKSCLFLSTGNLMHFLRRDQDSRNFGSLGPSYFSSVYFTLRVIRLAGFPFSLGFYSKDTIMGVLASQGINWNSILFLLGCCFTVAYRCKLVLIGLTGSPTFRARIRFTENNFFFHPLIIIYTVCLLSGNFFFFTYSPPVTLSWADLSIGLWVITLGVVLKSLFHAGYHKIVFLYSISFINRVTTITPKTIKSFPRKRDYSWGEMYSGKRAIMLKNIIIVSTGNAMRVALSASIIFITVLVIVG